MNYTVHADGNKATCGVSTTETGGSSSDDCANKSEKNQTSVRMKFFYLVVPTSQCKIAKIKPRTQFWRVFYTSIKMQKRKKRENYQWFWYHPCCPRCKLPGVLNNAGNFIHLEIWGKMSPLVEHETRFSEGWVVQSPSFFNFDDCFAMASMFWIRMTSGFCMICMFSLRLYK